ncbi:stage II sporulation protein P [Clostridium sp. CS001]|uniref:stage II sporulation protein P n=1 Tax=Clostridium sp. CS001 TaxID=2880648 RepID=UPI001CF4D184|nr:stage II sporulation protein P [Clostridium sp. CS001]MCB2290673.1 stage II sporulation protein P [Clostridium sp. CS001]
MNFSKHKIKPNSSKAMSLSLFTLLLIFLLGIALPKSINAYNNEINPNYFYINVINNVLPIIKCSNKDEHNLNGENAMKFSALSLLGMDIVNPISIIVKEIAYLNINEVMTNVNNLGKEDETPESLVITPFNLGNNQVTKSEAEVVGSDIVANLYNLDLKKTLNNAKPEVLIYHSHTCEAYRTSDKDSFKTNSSLDQTRGVVAVGDVIADELEKVYGIAVIHDKTVHDKGDYDASYKKSRVTLDKYLKEYGDFKLIIDLHRDSTDKSIVTTKINGESVAKYMFVVTTKNPRYPKQKELIDSMIETSNKLFPGLLRSNQIHAYEYGMSGFYSQNRSDNAIMFEVGSNTNTIDEAKNTGKYLSRIIAEQLNGKR